MYTTCRCPDCGKTFIAEISIDCLEKLIPGTEETKQYILDNVTIKTACSNRKTIQNLHTVLKSSIQDEETYNRVVVNLQKMFEEHI